MILLGLEAWWNCASRLFPVTVSITLATSHCDDGGQVWESLISVDCCREGKVECRLRMLILMYWPVV